MQAPLPVAAHRVKVVLASLSALFLVLFAFPVNLRSFLFGGASDVPLASVFMSWVREQILPPGWVLISSGGSTGITEQGGLPQPTLLVAEASLALTLIIGYPLIAFVLFERIVPPGVERYRRMVYALTLLASATFFAGVLFAFFFIIKFYILSLPVYFEGAVALDPSNFYLAGLGLVSILVLVSTLPFLLLGVARFRALWLTWFENRTAYP